jgi:hypothetical protein
MSILQKLANEESDNITGHLGARVSPELETAFRDYCGELNIKVAAAIRALIENELQGAGKWPLGAAADPLPVQPAAKPTKPKKASSSGRGALNAWVIGEGKGKKLPCPICDKWAQYSTFKARHVLAHGFQDVFHLFAEYPDKVEEMVIEAKQKAGE